MMPTEETVKAMVAWGWTVELDSARAVSKAQIKRKVSKLALVSANVILISRLSLSIVRLLNCSSLLLADYPDS